MAATAQQLIDARDDVKLALLDQIKASILEVSAVHITGQAESLERLAQAFATVAGVTTTGAARVGSVSSSR